MEQSNWQMDNERAHTLKFTLKKQLMNGGVEPWESLTLNPDHYTKKQILERRDASMQRYMDQLKKEREEKLKLKQQREKELLEKQWEIDALKRKEIEELKMKERLESTQDLADWSENVARKAKSGKRVQFSTTVDQEDEIDINQSNSEVDTTCPLEKEEEERKNIFVENDRSANLPPIRAQGGVVKLKFTPRTINTPAREDKDLEMLKKYEVWKANNKKNELQNEQNPIWIKVRGDKFFKNRNYLAAINAYTACCTYSHKDQNRSMKEWRPSNTFERKVISNRSVCHLMLNQFSECIKDCSLVIGSMDTPSHSIAELDTESQSLIKKCLIRRGTARWKCGELTLGMRDYEFVLTNMKSSKDDSVEEDYERMKLEFCTLDDKEMNTMIQTFYSVKQTADKYLMDEQYELALKEYSHLIHLTDHTGNRTFDNSEEEKLMIASYSNRALCYLNLLKFSECIQDCDFIVSYFGHRDADSGGGKKYNFILKALTRRGSAYCALGDYLTAYDDYEKASRMSPHDEAILRDMTQIAEKLKSSIEAEWLKNRGNYFYKQDNYQSAIHCYSLAIQKNRFNPVYYSNRAQCHLKLNDYIACINDCNTALSVLPDDVQRAYSEKLANPKSVDMKSAKDEKSELDEIPVNEQLTESLQLKLYVKRSKAFEMCEEWSSALQDMKRALQIDPANAQFRKTIAELELLLA